MLAARPAAPGIMLVFSMKDKQCSAKQSDSRIPMIVTAYRSCLRLHSAHRAPSVKNPLHSSRRAHMTSWQSATVQANGLRLHYTRTGGDKPPLVLAHGFSDAGLCWTPVARALEGDYDVIMVDARGHGQSQAAAQDYSDVDLGDDLAGVIMALGLRRPAVLGHSMGAATALALAGAHPEVPGVILLEDPPPRWVA